ncbi:MAG: hypothetical protein INH41_01070 [Myxococcaceae bacterium]|jgi:hypothetical protein|nr:hypothetical protein [Myxococcaceae bacterium]MCA3010970.1 hypothetical protein [Myxococcaceae bacterium]
MRLALVVSVVVVAGVARADVGPRPAPCAVPAGCVTCEVSVSDADAGAACLAGVADAGFKAQECSDRAGSVERRHFCPAGVTVTRSGCAAAGGALALAPLALWLLGRRRRAVSRG